MILSLKDGKHFYQWDRERVLIVHDNEIDQVHFATPKVEHAIARDVYDLEGARVVDVPATLLQCACILTAYAYKLEGDNREFTTLHEEFKIIARKKPDSYVEPEEIETWTKLDRRVMKLEENMPYSLSDLDEDAAHLTVTDEEKKTWNGGLDSLEKHAADEIRHITDEERNCWSNKSDFSGSYNDLSNKPSIPKAPADIGAQPAGNYLTSESDPTVPAWAKKETKPTYTPQEVGADPEGTAAGAVSGHNTAADAHNDIRLLVSEIKAQLAAFLDIDDTAVDQLSEVLALISANKGTLDSLTTSKVNVADIIDNLTTNVANKPLSAAQGVALKALIDALQTAVNSKAASTDLTNHTGNSTAHITAAERTAWNKNTTDIESLSEEIANYLPKNQGSANVGKILVVGTDGNLTLAEMPESSSGDVTGVVDEANNILLTGNLASGTYTMRYENEDGTLSEPVTMVVGAIVKYTITQNLTAVTSDNSVAEVRAGESLTVNLTANSGYNMKSITVTMGGTDITATAVSGGKISIASVTGDVVITAVAEEPNYTNLFDPSKATINKRLNSSQALVDLNGYMVTGHMDVSEKVPFTNDTKIYFKGAAFDGTSNTWLLSYKSTGTSYTDEYSSLKGNATNVTFTDEGNGVTSISGLGLAQSFVTDVKRMCFSLKVSDSAITEADIQNIVITIDEPIV